MVLHLKLKETDRDEDLIIRRFFPLDYTIKLNTEVDCPFVGRSFQTKSGLEMMNHQKLSKHPGWHRYDCVNRTSKPWRCSQRTCHRAFTTWGGCYKHMQSHSKPLACPVYDLFRTDRLPRMQKHIKCKHLNANVPEGHWTRKVGSKILAK